MACFVVPAAEAVVTTVVTKVVKAKENRQDAGKVHSISFSGKLKWLNNMLWGGSALLAFEHLWHGEIMPEFPFLTAVGNPQQTAEMLHEMSTTGVAMAAAVTGVWAVIAVAAGVLEKRSLRAAKAEQEALQ